jgi:hypothetical protein
MREFYEYIHLNFPVNRQPVTSFWNAGVSGPGLPPWKFHWLMRVDIIAFRLKIFNQSNPLSIGPHPEAGGLLTGQSRLTFFPFL